MAIELVVVTPEGEAFCEEIEQVVLPGEAGDFGVLESHERFLTPLQLGAMQIVRTSGTEWAALSNGFAEVDGSRVVVLVEADRAQVGFRLRVRHGVIFLNVTHHTHGFASHPRPRLLLAASQMVANPFR